MFYNLNFDAGSRKMFESLGINLELLLKDAGIPHRAVSDDKFQLTHDQYKAFVKAMDKYFTADIVLGFSKVKNVTMFVPEFFAGLCADTGVNCIKRISKYKKIIAPVDMIVTYDESTTSITYRYNDGDRLPLSMLLNSQASILSIIRQGTGIDDIKPFSVMTEYDYPQSVVEYLGVQPVKDTTNSIVFTNKDLKRPFITENNRMWDYLESELNRRLQEMEVDNSFAALVRKSLFELIPSGVSDVDKIAYELGVSKRTLQRRLKEEDTTFNEQLNHIRELLVRNYLKTNMTLDEIAFLVNYLDTKSLSRAFKTWTGMSVTDYRREHLDRET